MVPSAVGPPTSPSRERRRRNRRRDISAPAKRSCSRISGPHAFHHPKIERCTIGTNLTSSAVPPPSMTAIARASNSPSSRASISAASRSTACASSSVEMNREFIGSGRGGSVQRLSIGATLLTYQQRCKSEAGGAGMFIAPLESLSETPSRDFPRALFLPFDADTPNLICGNNSCAKVTLHSAPALASAASTAWL